MKINTHQQFIGTTLVMAVYLSIGMVWYLPNMGGEGLSLPQNLLCWGAISALVGWITISRWQPIWHSHASMSFILAGAVMLTLPLFWTGLEQWRLDAALRVAGLWAGLVFFFALLQIPLNARRIQLWLVILLVSADAQALMALCQRLVTSPDNWMEFNPMTKRPYGIFQQANLLGSYIAMGAGIAYYFVLKSSDRWLMMFSYLSLALLVSCLALQMSRTGWLGGISVWFLLSCLFFTAHRCRVLLASTVIFFIISLSYWIHLNLPAAAVDPEASNQTRLLILKYTWQMIFDKPVTGWGYGSFESQFAQFVGDGEPDRVLSRVTHPHNELLFGWVEGGVMALAGMLLLAAGACRLLANGRKILPVWLLGLPLWLHTQTEFPLYQSAPHWLAILLLFRLSIVQENITEHAFSGKAVWLTRVLLSALALTGILMTATGVVTSAKLTQAERRGLVEPISLDALPNPYIQWSRVQYDRHTAMLVEYNQTKNPALLESYLKWGNDYIQAHNDAAVYFNLIRIEAFRQNPIRVSELIHQAKKLFPGDNRF